ncbi:MAG: hypothetical protein CMB28_01845 [Euryarchaeota archaeon]|nr:hypothetical protein [Euryarchaeota archaeon]
MSKARIALVVTLFCLLPVPFVSAIPSGLTYLDSTWSTNDGDQGDLIALNPNGTILASYHGKDIILFNTSTFEQIGKISFDEDVAGMEFNPNGSVLAINKRSTAQIRESIKLVDVETLQVLDSGVLADDRFRDISWSTDGMVISAHGSEGEVVEQYRYPELTIKNTLHGVHVVDVTCIDYRSDGNYMITGDESGRWAIWNMQGQKQGSYIEYGEGLLDCKFAPDGLDIVLLGEDGKITSRTFDGIENHVTNITGAKEILFSDSGTRMHISVDSNNFKGLITFDYANFNELQRTNFFHKVEDVAFIEDEYSRIQTLFVSGGTGEVAVYLRDITANGFNEPGADLDGDSIPDDLDEDDDGDGIIDDWDDDIGCDAPVGTPCSRYPDLTKIRNIEISVGEKFVVKDQISLPSEDSSNIRNLSRNAIAKDQVLSAHETELFANAMCENMDHDDIIDQWRDSITLSNGELGEASISCFIVGGMEMIRDGDSTTQITFAIVTTFEYTSIVKFPLQITLDEQPLPTDGSISWLAPAHPMAVKFSGEDVVTQAIPLWWNDADGTVSVTIQEIEVKEPTIIETAVDWALHPISFILYLGILIGLGTLWLRHQNKIDFDIDEEVIEDEEIETEDETELEKVTEDDYEVEEEEVVKPKRTPPPSRRKMYSTSTDNVALVKKKRVADSQLNKDGPIMKTKRKRLDSIQDDFVSDDKPVVAAKKRLVKSTEPVIKTRKVKAEKKEDPKPEPVKKKKRKPVKRKKKDSDKKRINEEKMQEDLVSDFLKDE